MDRVQSIWWLLGGGLVLGGALVVILPEQAVLRAYALSEAPAANIHLVYALGIALIGTGLAVTQDRGFGAETVRPWVLWAAALTPVLYFLVLALHLRDWWIDDAGITFAYSRSLTEGHGLVAQPWMPREEGYSSSVWMLMLAGLGRLGVDIPLAAKTLGTAFSAVSMALCAWILARETRSPLALLICGIGIACAPTVVWAVSGQEHALQGLLLLAVVVCVYRLEHWRWPVAALLAVFVLTRPEAPIVVVAVFCAAVLLTRRAGGPLVNAGDAAVALVPFLVFVGLIGFRLAYFGDPMPNPYYAKSSGTSFIGLLNPLGGGWAYIVGGLRDTGLLLVVGLAVLIRMRPLPDWFVIAVAVLAGHAVFVVWAKGDWMSQYRFLMPVLPLALLVLSFGLRGLPTQGARRAFAVVAVLVLVQTTALQLTAFKARPTTPMAAVTEVGYNFRDLAGRLGIDDPVLAHHDAGGISYHRAIRLIDLGGLVNRTIARHMDDRAFLTAHLLEEVRPEFFFGARNFAAASGFADTEAFAHDYVRVEFVGRPHLQPYLSHMRRDRVAAAPGVVPVYDDAGVLVAVQVDPRGGTGS